MGGLFYWSLLAALFSGGLGICITVIAHLEPELQLNASVLGWYFIVLAIYCMGVTLYALNDKVDKESARRIAVPFFHWWWNHNGSNTEQGFDEWWEIKEADHDND